MIYKKIGTGLSFNKGRPVLNIYARDENNKRTTIPVEGLDIYFYVKEGTNIEKADMVNVIKITDGYYSIYGDRLQKVFVSKISAMHRLSKMYHGYEGDINWDKKMCLDMKITDTFWYSNNKVYSLDERFIGPVTKNVSSEGMSSEVTLSGDVDDLEGKSLMAKKIDFKFRICCIDIECIVDSKEKLNTYDGEIVCVVLFDSYTKKYHCLKSNEIGGERQLLRDVFQVIKECEFDIFTGWNVGFDVRWIIKRAEYYDIDLSEFIKEGKTEVIAYNNKQGKFIQNIRMPGRAIMDGKDLYVKQTQTTEKRASYSLKSIAIVEGFDEWDDLGTSVKKNWEADPDKVVEYCRLDVERTYQIIEKKSLIENAITLCGISGANLDESMWNSKVIDSMLFLYKGNRVLPNIVYRTDEKNIEGARVMKSIKGKHDGVVVLDAASLYPRVIVGCNISGETLVTPKNEKNYIDSQLYHIKINVNGDDKVFKYVKPEIKVGLLPEIVVELRKMREGIRDARRIAVEEKDDLLFKQLNDEEKVIKGLLASVYGVTGFDSFRLFNEDCANSITGIARGVVIETLDKLQSDRFNIIYGDTDSLFIQVRDYTEGYEAVKRVNDIMLKYVNKFGVNETVIDMNYEKHFKWIFFSQEPSVKLKTKIRRKETKATKKKYIGFIDYVEGKDGKMTPTNELYYKGFELRRSDASKVLKRVMKQFFVLMEDGDCQKSVDYIKHVKSEFSTYSLDDLAMPRAVNKEEAAGPYSRGMKFAKNVLKFDFVEDELPKLVYVKPQSKYPATNEICYQDHHTIPECFEIDYNKMFDKLITMKFEPILEALGEHWDVAINGQSSMDMFCK